MSGARRELMRLWLLAWAIATASAAMDVSAHGGCSASLTPLPESPAGATAQIKILSTGHLIPVDIRDMPVECVPFEITVGRVRARVRANNRAYTTFECATFERCPVPIASSFSERVRSFYDHALGASRGDYDVDAAIVLPWGRILDARSLRRADARSAQGTYWRLEVTEQPGKQRLLEREGKGESFDLPENAFHPGQSYTWTFVSGAATVRHEFTLLGEEEAARVRARIAGAIAGDGPEAMDAARRWRLIEVYAAEELFYEAAWHRADILGTDKGSR